MNEELMRLIELLTSGYPAEGYASTSPYRTAPTEGDIDLIREENARAILDEEERKMQYLRELAYRSGADVPLDASLQRLREEAYRVPSPRGVEMFDPAVGGSMATTRDDPLRMIMSLLR